MWQESGTFGRLGTRHAEKERHFQSDPLTAPFKRYDEGATMTQIRDWLNEQGVKNSRNQKLTYNSVQHLLNNRRYIGAYRYRDIVVPEVIPAIVPQDLFDRVQDKLAKLKVNAEVITFWLHRFRKPDVRQKPHRKMLIDTFINSIFLYDNKTVITFNYKEGTTPSTLTI